MKKRASKKNKDEDSEDLDINILEDATSDSLETEEDDSDFNEEGEHYFVQKLMTHERVSGMIVETKLGRGQTKNNDTTFEGKIPVYLDDGRKILCKPENIKRIGFYD